MSRYVVDASVVLKWFVPEILEEAALQYRTPAQETLAPDLILAETGNALWKKARRGELTRAKAITISQLLTGAPLKIFPSAILLDQAVALALEHDRCVYDSLYLALAVEEDCALVTADRKFHNAMQATPLGRRVRWVEMPP